MDLGDYLVIAVCTFAMVVIVGMYLGIAIATVIVIAGLWF